jgi:hypothetical protein
MSGGGKRAKLPPSPAPAPTPESIQEGALDAASQERLAAKKRKGRRSTILTEGGLGVTNTEQKKSLLG